MAPAWRYLVAALVVAEAAHEKYVIQAFAPEHAGAIDAKPPKTPPTRHGRSRLLSAMSFRSTRSLAAASVGSGSSRSATSSRKSYRG